MPRECADHGDLDWWFGEGGVSHEPSAKTRGSNPNPIQTTDGIPESIPSEPVQPCFGPNSPKKDTNAFSPNPNHQFKPPLSGYLNLFIYSRELLGVSRFECPRIGRTASACPQSRRNAGGGRQLEANVGPSTLGTLANGKLCFWRLPNVDPNLTPVSFHRGVFSSKSDDSTGDFPAKSEAQAEKQTDRQASERANKQTTNRQPTTLATSRCPRAARCRLGMAKLGDHIPLWMDANQEMKPGLIPSGLLSRAS